MFFFGGFLSQLSKYNSFHLQIRYHTADDVLIASNETASATHVRTRHHTADKRVHRYIATNAFCAGPETNTFGAGDERVSRRRRARFALETNKLKTYVRTPATHTASYQRLPNELQLHTQLATSDFQTELLSR